MGLSTDSAVGCEELDNKLQVINLRILCSFPNNNIIINNNKIVYIMSYFKVAFLETSKLFLRQYYSIFCKTPQKLNLIPYSIPSPLPLP